MSTIPDDSQVLIVGAGPVGLTLALDLGRRGIRCTVIERESGPRRLPKMERSNARSMEIFRRLGVADDIRAAGLPSHVPMDVFITTRLVDPPILRLPYPSVDDARARARHVTDGSEPLEPYQLISQYSLEPVLLDAVRATPGVQVVFDCELQSFSDDGNEVTATVATGSGKAATVTVPYLVGCDGGASTVRKALGIPLQGRGGIAQLRQVFFRSRDLTTAVPRAALGRHFYIADAEARMIGTAIVVQDDQQHFVFHSALPVDADFAAAIIEAVGAPIDVEVLAVNEWKLHLLLAERYAEGRVFLAGDAVRLVIPQGGLGMNTGVVDATDLGWKLAAVLQGWGGPRLLQTYEFERRQVGERVVHASQHASEATAVWRRASQPWIGEDCERGAATRAEVAAVADVEQRKSHEMRGIELGYRYVDSPIVSYEEGPQPEPFSLRYSPTASPGSRLPHIWLDDGSPLHDHIGSGFALLRIGDVTGSVQPMCAAFDDIGARLQVVDVAAEAAAAVYGSRLVLVRPDLHVAWRGDALPDEARALACLVTGWD